LSSPKAVNCAYDEAEGANEYCQPPHAEALANITLERLVGGIEGAVGWDVLGYGRLHLGNYHYGYECCYEDGREGQSHPWIKRASPSHDEITDKKILTYNVPL